MHCKGGKPHSQNCIHSTCINWLIHKVLVIRKLDTDVQQLTYRFFYNAPKTAYEYDLPIIVIYGVLNMYSNAKF